MPESQSKGQWSGIAQVTSSDFLHLLRLLGYGAYQFHDLRLIVSDNCNCEYMHIVVRSSYNIPAFP